MQNNELLGARSRIWALFGILVALLMVVPLTLANMRGRAAKSLAEAQQEVVRLNVYLKAANDKLERRELYDSRHNVWEMECLTEFEASLKKRNAPYCVVQLQFFDDEGVPAFLEKARFMLGQEVIRFSGGSRTLVLLMVGKTFQEASGLLRVLAPKGTSLVERSE